MFTSNFDFLKHKWSELSKLGSDAEEYIYSDPQSALLKLRCFIEVLVNTIYRDLNLFADVNWDLYSKLKNDDFLKLISKPILSKFHAIRIKANKAIHANQVISAEDSIWLIKEAYFIACWVYKSYHKDIEFKCNAFNLPVDSGKHVDLLNKTIQELEKTLELEKQNNYKLAINNLNNIETTNSFKNKNNEIAGKMNINNDEINRRISLEDIFTDYNLTKTQNEAIYNLNQFFNDKTQNVFLLKGYAGTGKTFLTKGLTEYLTSLGIPYILAAPTGKAAKVIANKTQNEAYTIHKTIYSTNDVKEYKENENDKTYKFYFDLRVNEDPNNTIYIIDEASMISNVYGEPEFFRFGSGFLLQDLLKYINIDCNDHNKKIIFIGDNAQLPPIGMNFSPALDNQYLTKTFNLMVDEYELTEVVRQKSDSGILANTVPIRKSLVAQTFNQLDIKTNHNDVSHVEHDDFLNTYLKESEYKIDPDTIVIAFSNASVKEYNDKIREHYFPGNTNNIVVNDKIMVTANNGNYEIFLSNGDFGIVQEVSYKPEVKQIVTKNGIINETLYFRDVTILFYSLNGIPYSIKCKIIENLFYSDKPNLSSDEHKAIYVDFMMRHPHLKANTKEWKDALKKDLYFNALKIKFGYAITCHKAQGSEWKNVFLNCKTHESVLSQSYFRWIYTALTRASEKLFTLDEPHFTPFTRMQQNNEPIQKPVQDPIVNTVINNESSQDMAPLSLEDSIYSEVKILLDQSNIKIKDITHNQYCEQYTLELNDEICRIKINYNGKNKITKISAIETNTLAKLAELSLKQLENKTLFVTNSIEKTNQFTFAENFLEEYYNAILNAVNQHNIDIIQIEHFNYLERYTFKQNNEISIIDFYYNGKKQFTRSQPQNNSSIELSKLILSLLN